MIRGGSYCPWMDKNQGMGFQKETMPCDVMTSQNMVDFYEIWLVECTDIYMNLYIYIYI